ncbi:F-box/LRR-repeat protein [Actinidia chinensis var. chinensis]|uniref:F-box/LRR-repeat protein n=1 Tax=Actinidia chinensis var. chinensis TaxID=1590841 RepID=A0A2R6QGB2_ACTCC|nr:F-box/LRR-repeat protein [Actinidia chinensis var. chinensis]
MTTRTRRQRQRETNTQREERESGGGTTGIDLIGEDLLQNILSRLPALTFASAACVSHSWNTLCNRVLCRPKLSSAFSLNPSPKGAVEEVVDKVLSEPLRPHFAIACVSYASSLKRAQVHQLITQKLGSTIPIVTYKSSGIIGRNAITNDFKEVQWHRTLQEDPGAEDDNLSSKTVTDGILLVVGFLPGLKVDAVPLARPIEDRQAVLVDEFVMDIREFTAYVSDCTSPAGIMMFGGLTIDVKPVLDKLDYAMSTETFIVGDESGHFLYRELVDSGKPQRRPRFKTLGVALVFARDRNKPHGIGEIGFHVALSSGLSPIGPVFKAAAVKERRDLNDSSTWLTARREEHHDILDGQTMLSDISDEIGDHFEYTGLYIGVTKRRKYSVELEKVRWISSLAFHEVSRGDEEYLFVYGSGIKTGDSFRFYYSDSSTASSSCSNVSSYFRRLKQDQHDGICPDVGRAAANGSNKEIFGGIIFSCCGRGEPFFDRPNVDSSPFLENFPGVPLAGTFCCGEIGRCSSSLYNQEGQEQSAVRCCLHAYSSVYLVMSYTPALPEH